MFKFIDDSKLLKQVNDLDDIASLQDDLDLINSWAEINHMCRNLLKFQMLRFGTKSIRSESNVFAPNLEEVIEVKETVSDLGIMIDDNLSYNSHIKKVISKVNNLSAWALRTFRSRDKYLMKKIWRSLIQCHADYGCILWYPVGRIGEMRALEDPLRSFTKRVSGMWNKSYSERLEHLNMSSIERRTERYMIIYIWKSINGFVPTLGLDWNAKSTGCSGPVLNIDAIRG